MHMREAGVLYIELLVLIAMDVFYCSFCNHFSASSMEAILRHIGAVHSHDPNFHTECGIDGCLRTYRNYYSFRKHLRSKHFDHLRSLNPVTSPEDMPELNSDTLFAENTQLLTADQRLKSSALFLLKSKEIDHLSQHSLDNIVGEVTSIVLESLSRVERHVSCTLQC